MQRKFESNGRKAEFGVRSRPTRKARWRISNADDTLYADDTLLVGTSEQTIEKQLACIVELGATYGLDMNWKKVELMKAKDVNAAIAKVRNNTARYRVVVEF